MSHEQQVAMHERLRKLQELDESTKIPCILVELRGHGTGDGYIEICGKDEYGVYAALDEYLTSDWQCRKLNAGDLSEDTPVPFCDVMYRWKGFRAQSRDGLNNMGLATMRLVDFMCKKLSWTLGVINGGNVGKRGEIREQQIIFKAPHPMNLVAHHVMVELRSAGFIEVCGGHRRAMDTLHTYFEEKFSAKLLGGAESFCDRFYSCEGNSGFQNKKRTGDNNLGLLTTQVCDAVVKLLPGWSLVTLNGGNCGEDGTQREQQLVFRWDNHPLRESPHLLVELREEGFVEVNGENVGGIHKALSSWLANSWGCKELPQAWITGSNYCDKKLSWAPRDMMEATAEITSFFHQLGWQMQVCSQGTVSVKGKTDCREQQILFRPGSSGAGYVEPHLLIELYTGEGLEELYARPEVTQVLGNQHIRVQEVGDCRLAARKLEEFLCNYLGSVVLDQNEFAKSTTYSCDVFLSRGLTDNNLGCWTMRLCDFMCDCLGWSFVVCNVCNLGPSGQYREQQLVFRYDGERRAIPLVRDNNFTPQATDFMGIELPSYWTSPEVRSLKKAVKIQSCNQDEITDIQEIFDATFKRVLTRDRIYEYQLGVEEEMPYRLEVVHAFRSENAELFRGLVQRRASYAGGGSCEVKTQGAGKMLNARLLDGEALLAHGTSPSSAMGILKNGFRLDNAGKSTGLMFGYGLYLAECVSKSDEYAQDDAGGSFPGLRAMLLCRCLVGNPYVVHDAGEHVSQAQAAGYDCVLGDRESKVGTYREFVFFDESQVLPEYAVIYRRQYNRHQVPKLMRQNTFGTTGKNWQVKLDKGWVNIPPHVTYELNSAESRGEYELVQQLGGESYRFNLSNRQQTNVRTGTSRQIRPPMRR